MTRSLLSRLVTVAAVVALAAACGGTADGQDTAATPTTDQTVAEDDAGDDTAEDDAGDSDQQPDAPTDDEGDDGQDDDTTDEPSDDADAEDDDPAAAEGDCSASGTTPADVVAVTDMPSEVADLRDFLADAALRCDEQLLFTAIEESEMFTYSFGDDGDAIGFWWELEAAGDEPYRRIVDVLSTTPALDADAGLWVWPAVATGQDGTDAPELLAELEPWSDPAALEDLDGSGYLGWRIGISTDGEWRYFVAGD